MSDKAAGGKVRRQGRRLDAAQRERWALARDVLTLVLVLSAIGALAYLGWPS